MILVVMPILRKKEHGNYTIVTSGQLYNELPMKC